MKLPKYKFDRFMIRHILKMNNTIDRIFKKNPEPNGSGFFLSLLRTLFLM